MPNESTKCPKCGPDSMCKLINGDGGCFCKCHTEQEKAQCNDDCYPKGGGNVHEASCVCRGCPVCNTAQEKAQVSSYEIAKKLQEDAERMKQDAYDRHLLGLWNPPAPSTKGWEEELREEVAGNMTSVEAVNHLIEHVAKALAQARAEGARGVEGYVIRHPFDGFRRDTYETLEDAQAAARELDAYHNVEHTVFAIATAKYQSNE